MRPPLSYPFTFRDPDGQDVNMDDETYTETTQGHSDNPLASSPNGIDVGHEPPSIGVDPTGVVLQPGETLIVYHPHSWRPTRIVPTAEPHGPCKHTVRHVIRKPEDSYALFPTRADFEQAEIFVNNNCSDKYINDQLKFEHQHGMRLEVKTARKMHKLLARGFGEDTDDSQVGSIHSTIEISHSSQDPVSSVGRRSRFRISKVSSRRIERSQFVTVLRWMKYFA